MKTLVINSGSSSLKATIFEKNKELAKAHIDGIGLDSCKFIFKSGNKNVGHKHEVKNHTAAFAFAMEQFIKYEALAKKTEIDRVAHRVVHGGEKFTGTTKIDAKVIKEIEKFSNLAPLHNPVNLESIQAAKKALPKAKHFAIFDTAFHQTMPEKAYLYALPHDLYKKEGIRRYGFHGTNHKYVVDSAIKLLKNKKARIISCHLGNGGSITASVGGKSIDTSMGFTPLEGIMMGTRSGSIDPAITFHLQHNLKMKPAQVDKLLNHESGLLGISGSSDMRDVHHKSLKKDERATLAIEMLAYQIAKYCGAYAAAMKGLDAVVFTGGLGEKAFYVREKACEYLEHLGLKLDKKRNASATKLEDPTEISPARAKIRAFVIPANEAREMANEVKNAK